MKNSYLIVFCSNPEELEPESVYQNNNSALSSSIPTSEVEFLSVHHNMFSVFNVKHNIYAFVTNARVQKGM